MEQDKGLPPKLIIGISANDQQKIAEEAKESGMDISTRPHNICIPSHAPITHPPTNLINTSYQCILSSGMDGFMHKPFKLATLMDVIEDISNRRKQVCPQC